MAVVGGVLAANRARLGPLGVRVEARPHDRSAGVSAPGTGSTSAARYGRSHPPGAVRRSGATRSVGPDFRGAFGRRDVRSRLWSVLATLVVVRLVGAAATTTVTGLRLAGPDGPLPEPFPRRPALARTLAQPPRCPCRTCPDPCPASLAPTPARFTRCARLGQQRGHRACHGDYADHRFGPLVASAPGRVGLGAEGAGRRLSHRFALVEPSQALSGQDTATAGGTCFMGG